MRLVSQDGTYDIPYNLYSVHLFKSYDCYKVLASGYENYTLATYSTEQKALKAINMLRCAYTRVVIIQNVEKTKEALERLKSVNVVLSKIDSQPSNIEYINNTIFQFPKDEEIKV